MILLAASIIILRLGLLFDRSSGFALCFLLPHLYHKLVKSIVDTDTSEYLPFIKIFVYVELKSAFGIDLTLPLPWPDISFGALHPLLELRFHPTPRFDL